MRDVAGEVSRPLMHVNLGAALSATSGGAARITPAAALLAGTPTGSRAIRPAPRLATHLGLFIGIEFEAFDMT